MSIEGLFIVLLAVAGLPYLTGLPFYFAVYRRSGGQALESYRQLTTFALYVFPAFVFFVLLSRDLVLRAWPSLVPEHPADFTWVVLAPLLVALHLATHRHAMRIAASKSGKSPKPPSAPPPVRDGG